MKSLLEWEALWKPAVRLCLLKDFVNRVEFLKDFYFSNFKDSEDSTEEVFHDAQEN